MNASDWCILTAVTVRQNYGYDGWLGIARSAVPNTLTQISPTVLLSLSQSPSLSHSLSHSISLSFYARLWALRPVYRHGNSYFLLCIAMIWDQCGAVPAGCMIRSVPYDSLFLDSTQQLTRVVSNSCQKLLTAGFIPYYRLYAQIPHLFIYLFIYLSV